MEIDDGRGGLEQSRHHPQHQQASYNAPADGPPNMQRELSDLEAKIHGIFIGSGVQIPPRRLLEGLTALVLAVRDDALT